MLSLSALLSTVAVMQAKPVPPSGLIVDLTLEEMAAEMKLNEQYEKESIDGNYRGPANISTSSGFKACNQVCSNWCWATGSTMAASAFTGVSSCGTDEEKVAQHVYGTPCSTSCPSNCNQGGTTANIADGVKFLSGHSYQSGGVLSQSALDNALNHGPVVVGVQWSLGGGHAITVHGKSGGNYKIHDPENEDHTVPYSGITTYRPSYASGEYTGKWFGSAYTSSGADVVSPPSGLIVDLTAEEMATEMALNEQYERDSVEGNYHGPSNISTSNGFKACNQVCSNWCWATGSTMAASAFTGVSSCGTDEEKVAQHVYGTPCSTSCPSNCNQGGTTANIADGVKFLSGHSYQSGGVLSQSALDSALNHGPVVVGVQWSLGGGHAITVHGKSGGKYKIHDPENEDHTVSYSGITTYKPSYASGRYTGKWFGSAYTSSGADVAV